MRRYADENEERGHEEPAADAEKSGQEPDHPTHAEKQKDIHGHLGDGQVNLHRGAISLRWRGAAAASRPRHSTRKWTKNKSNARRFASIGGGNLLPKTQAANALARVFFDI